jgi:hypothetical protein
MDIVFGTQQAAGRSGQCPRFTNDLMKVLQSRPCEM